MSAVITELLTFALACLIVIIVPGPDMMLMLRNTTRAGRTGALWTAAGIMTGLGILAAAAALGITALLTASPTLIHTIQIASGLYLIYLAAQSLRTLIRPERHGPRSTDHEVPAGSGAPDPQHRSHFLQGLLNNLLNPKIAAFYLALFPQFDLTPVPAAAQHILLATIFWTLCLIWYITVVAAIGKVAQLLQAPKAKHYTEILAGGSLGALGVYILASGP